MYVPYFALIYLLLTLAPSRGNEVTANEFSIDLPDKWEVHKVFGPFDLFLEPHDLTERQIGIRATPDIGCPVPRPKKDESDVEAFYWRKWDEANARTPNGNDTLLSSDFCRINGVPFHVVEYSDASTDQDVEVAATTGNGKQYVIYLYAAHEKPSADIELQRILQSFRFKYPPMILWQQRAIHLLNWAMLLPAGLLLILVVLLCRHDARRSRRRRERAN